MDEIRVNDVVMVVHSCCGVRLGVPFTVERVATLPHFHCYACNFHITEPTPLAGTASECCPQSWLKKLPPLTEPESIEHTEEQTA